jgi:hypothetical protein
MGLGRAGVSVGETLEFMVGVSSGVAEGISEAKRLLKLHLHKINNKPKTMIVLFI